MKCKFERDEDCCNSSSEQYMCKCKPDVCHSAVPMTNADRIREMSDFELANFLDDVQRKECESLHLLKKDGTLRLEEQPQVPVHATYMQQIPAKSQGWN